MFTESDGTVTDETLMEAVRNGDLAKLGILFERHHRALFDFLVRMTGSASTAEDLVQDVFVRVLKYRATWRGEGRFDTWLFRIARNARITSERALRMTGRPHRCQPVDLRHRQRRRARLRAADV